MGLKRYGLDLALLLIIALALVAPGALCLLAQAGISGAGGSTGRTQRCSGTTINTANRE